MRVAKQALTGVAGLIFLVLPTQVAEADVSPDPAAAPAGHYVIDRRHAAVSARVRHMGLSLYTMRFDQFDASYDYDPSHPLASRVTVTVDARSLDTGNEAVSKQFADEFLDAGRRPLITFKATDIETTGLGRGHVTGDLTLRGLTRPVTLDVTYDGTASNLIGGRRMGFSATTTVRRSDFGSKAWQGAVGDDVQVMIEAEFVRQ
jgi:polyisoprenoid-binding protein YceI